MYIQLFLYIILDGFLTIYSETFFEKTKDIYTTNVLTCRKK